MLDSSYQEDRAARRGADAQPILSQSEWVIGSHLFFAATGVTDNPLFQGVRYHGDRASFQLHHSARRPTPPHDRRRHLLHNWHAL